MVRIILLKYSNFWKFSWIEENFGYVNAKNPLTRFLTRVYDLAVIRASIPKLQLDDVFEQKNDIAKSVEQELEKAMFAYGYEIVQTLIVDIEPDEKVKKAMNEINAGKHLPTWVELSLEYQLLKSSNNAGVPCMYC